MSVRGNREEERRAARGSGRTSRAYSRTKSLLAVGVVAAVAACSLAVESGRNQCTANADCTSSTQLGPTAVCRGGTCVRDGIVDAGQDVEVDAPPEDPAWACLDDELVRIPADTTVHVFARYQTLAGAPVANLSVSACAGLGACSSPLAGTPILTKDDGLLAIETQQSVPGGFRGTLETTRADGGPGFLPSVLLVQPGESNTHSVQPPGEERPRYPTQLLTDDDVAAYAAAAGRTPELAVDPAAAVVVVTALDCRRDAVVDATIAIDITNPNTATLYLDDEGKPNKDLAKTSKSGRVVMLNVPAGSRTLGLIRADGTRAVSQSLLVAAGKAHYVYLAPPLSPPGL